MYIEGLEDVEVGTFFVHSWKIVSPEQMGNIATGMFKFREIQTLDNDNC